MWPRFVRNTSDRFEARFSLVEVTQSPSLLLQGMVGSQMPIAVSHGEGRVEVRDAAHLAALESKGLVALRYVDNFGKVTETYWLTRTVLRMVLRQSRLKVVESPL